MRMTGMKVKGVMKDMGLKAGFRSLEILKEREGREGKGGGVARGEEGGHPQRGCSLRASQSVFWGIVILVILVSMQKGMTK